MDTSTGQMRSMNTVPRSVPLQRAPLGTALLVCITLEAALLGGGRLLVLHGLTLKMWLFIAAQIYTLWQMIFACRRLSASTILILASFSVLLLTGISIGVMSGAGEDAIIEDVKPLIYLLLLAFFELTIRSDWHLRLVLAIMKSCALLMAIAYVAVLGLLAVGVLPFSVLYAALSNVGVEDFMFRGDTGAFFYKGAIYLGIGVILFAKDKGWKAVLPLCILAGGLLATGTRGFFLGLAAAMLAHIVLSTQPMIRRLRYATAFLVLALLTWAWFASSAADRSDSARSITFHEVSNRILPISLLVGHGFGNGVPEKPVHMEIAYLEIFHKQGVVGLGWWIGIMTFFCGRYWKARRLGNPHAEPLFLCVLFVATVSATNPFINNPIGITICLVALVGLNPEIRSLPRFDMRASPAP